MKNFLVLCFACIVAWVHSQKTITGKVIDADGKSIPSASITITDSNSEAILTYGISNTKGEFKLTFTTEANTADVRIKAFNQKPFRKTIKNENANHSFQLVPDVTEIKEVKLKTKLITKKGDTISYDLKAFENKADRSLADVIKKLPGVEVKSDGTILYQGEPLVKFTVNGKDLMEGGYGVITNSLPKDAVSKVEILENHQPIKILQDKVPSDKAAINIRLKKQITMTGRGEIGVGLSPLLWNVKLTPMFFGQKNQWVVNYKTNNNGESVENEGNMLAFGNRWEGRRSQASRRNWIGINTAATPSVPEKRYLLNNVHFFSANLLTNPFKNKEWELKLNTSYSNNHIERASYSEKVYEPSALFPSGAVYSSYRNNNFYNNHTKGEMIFLKNAKKGFFKNITSWNSFWNNANNITNVRDEVSNNPFDINSGMQSPTGVFSNSLSAIVPWGEKLVNVMSYISYQKDRQSATSYYNNFMDLDNILSTSNISKLHQDISLKTIQVNHSASVGFSYKKWTITPEAGINIEFNDMNSHLFANNNLMINNRLGDSFQNNFSWNEVNPYTQVGINYKNSGINLNINLPMNFYGINYKDFIDNTRNKSINKTIFTPNLWVNYEFASYFKWWGHGSISRSLGNFGDIYAGNMLTSPQIIQNNNSPLPDNENYSTSTRLEYRNPLNNLFFNVRYAYNLSSKNLIYRTKLSPSGAAITELIHFQNKPSSQSEGAEIGKYFPKFKSNVSFSFSNSDSKSFTQQVDAMNDTKLYETKVNSQSLGFKFNNTFFSWLSVDYNLAFNWYNRTNTTLNMSNKSQNWTHNLSTYIYPSANHTIGFLWDNSSFEQNGTILKNSFFDVSYQYTWVKRKMDFEIKWLNIANKKAYETISYNATELSTSRSVMYIRPSQVMFSVKFNFK